MFVRVVKILVLPCGSASVEHCKLPSLPGFFAFLPGDFGLVCPIHSMALPQCPLRARRHFAEAVIPRPTDRFRGRRRFGAHAVLHSGNEQKFQQRRRTKANLCCFSNFDGRGRQVFKFNNLDEDRLFFTNNFNHCEVSPRGAQFFIETKGRVAA